MLSAAIHLHRAALNATNNDPQGAKSALSAARQASNAPGTATSLMSPSEPVGVPFSTICTGAALVILQSCLGLGESKQAKNVLKVCAFSPLMLLDALNW